MTTDTLANGLAAVFGSSTTPTSSSVIPFGVVSSNKFSPSGYTNMSNLASVLGVNKLTMSFVFPNATYKTDFSQWALNAAAGVYIGSFSAGWVAMIWGFKYSNDDGAFYIMRANGQISEFGHYDNGSFIVVYE